jgi:glycine/D-amino acid oxidase-like deaminating enzyme/nitrite reductase/ring-hydroxylating ferredoxin subunit
MASSIRRNSIWLANAGVHAVRGPTTFAPAQNLRDVHFDTVVVGGGVFGCTTAYKLKSQGQRVALFESLSVGSQTSGTSTAKLSAGQTLVYTKISTKQNEEVARKYYDFNTNGIDTIEQLVSTLNLDCEFERRSHTTWTNKPDEVDKVKYEADLCRRLNIPVDLLGAEGLAQELPASIGATTGVCFPNQAQFNPYKYCKELCRHIEGGGSHVYEDSRVTSVDASTPHVIQLEENNCRITADNVVLATHMPIMDRSMHFAMLTPSRSHCVAARVRNNPIRNMSMNVDAERSLRSSGDIVILCGGTMKQGEHVHTNKFYDELATWLQEHFEVEEIVCKWSAMDYFSGDHIPFIGHLYRGTTTIFTATGFSKWGLAAGAAGANIVSALIRGEKDPQFLDIVDSCRWDLTVQGKNIVEEAVHTAKHMIKDKIKALMPTTLITELPCGEGKVVSAGSKHQHLGVPDEVGAYRDEEGKLHVIHPVCTHMGCTLVFNDGDKMWDCPCHGSRFSVDGAVVHGPATKCLACYTELEW